MSQSTIPIDSFFKKVQEKWKNIQIPEYKFRQFYSTENQIFFDCDGELGECLENVLKEKKFLRFVVYFIIKDINGDFSLMDVSFANIGSETLEHFIKRYPTQLKPSSVMALQLNDKEYVEYLGSSYET